MLIINTSNNAQWIQSHHDIEARDLYSIYFVDAENGWTAGGAGIILHTSNGGQDWHQQNITANSWDKLYALYFVDKLNGFAAGDNGLFYKTTDGGVNWSNSNAPGSSTFRALSFADKNTGWGGTLGGILKTTDGGKTWNAQLSNQDAFVRYLHFIDHNTGWAIYYDADYYSSSTKIVKTTDGGDHWVVIDTLFYGDVKGAGFIENTFFAFNGYYLYKSEDYGENWQEFSKIEDALYFDHESIFFCSKSIGYIIIESWIEKTTDGGITWKRLNIPERRSFNSLYFTSENTGWAVGNGSYIIKITEGGSQWEMQKGKMLSNARLYSVDFPSYNTGFAAGQDWAYGTGGIIKTTNSGETWSAVKVEIPAKLNSIDFVSVNTGWTVGDSGYIYKTTNGGTDWTIQNSGTKANLTSITMIDSLKGIITGSLTWNSGLILRTSDGGNSWIKTLDNTQYHYTFAKHTGNTGWAASSVGTVLKTIDAGISWVELTISNEYLTSICVLDTLKVFASGFDILFKSVDGGRNWSSIPITTKDHFSAQQIFFADDNTGWAIGTGLYTIYKTTDGGESWFPNFGDGFGWMHSIYFIDAMHGWAVGEAYETRRTGLLRTENGGGGIFVEVNNQDIPSEYKMEQCYPNPFNPSTKIIYHLPFEGRVSLKIYDILGKETAVLFDNTQTAGTHEIGWDGSHCSSGIYFYVLNAGGQTYSRKMILMK